MARTRCAPPSRSCREKGLVYQGRLPPPKGHDDGEWEDREQTLFKSTQFGDDVDRALQKSDGGYTYFASDMAYHRNKIGRGFQHLINVFGADHVGYITRMKAAVAALSDGKVDLDIKVCQLVKLFRGGEPVKMSKRAGTFVTLRDVVDEVGPRPRPLHDAVPQERCAARFRPRQGGGAVEGQSGFLCAVRARPRAFGVSQRGGDFSPVRLRIPQPCGTPTCRR